MGLKNQIGTMDRFVTIVEFTNGKDAFNSNTRVQTTVKQVWAQRLLKSSGENFEEKVYSINKFDFVVHFDPVITAKKLQDLAVVDDGKTYYVKGADTNFGGRNMYILFNTELNG